MFLKLKTLHFLDLIHIAIFVCVQQKKSITCKVLHSTAHGISHSISATYMSWVHFDYRWFPRVSLESPSPTVSTSALWRVQTLTLYSHMQMKLHMHDEKYDVDIFAACSQLEILRRKKKWFDADPKRSSKRSSKQLLDTRSTWSICIVGRFPRSRGRSVHGWSFRLL